MPCKVIVFESVTVLLLLQRSFSLCAGDSKGHVGVKSGLIASCDKHCMGRLLRG